MLATAKTCAVMELDGYITEVEDSAQSLIRTAVEQMQLSARATVS